MPKLHPVFSIILMLVIAAVVRNIERIEFLGVQFSQFDAAGISALKIAGGLAILALLTMGFTYLDEK